MKKQKIKCNVCECKHQEDDECVLDQIKVDYSKEINDPNTKDVTLCDNYKKK